MVWHENISALRKDELETVRKTKKEFKKEVKFVERLLNIFLKTFGILGDLVETNKEFTNSEHASYRISWRIFRIVHCAFDSSLKGYYDISMALLRIAFENHLLQAYLCKNEEEAKLWFEGKTFPPAFLRKNAYYSGSSLYRGMSEFVHSSFRSTLSSIKIEKDKQRGVLGEYDKKQFEIGLKPTLMTLWTTILWLVLFTIPEISMNKEWRSSCWDDLLEITRHIKTL